VQSIATTLQMKVEMVYNYVFWLKKSGKDLVTQGRIVKGGFELSKKLWIICIVNVDDTIFAGWKKNLKWILTVLEFKQTNLYIQFNCKMKEKMQIS